MKKRALVTGAPGFIGRRVVRRLLDAGWEVTSLSLPGEVPPADWNARVRMVYGDLTDEAVVRDAATGAGLAVHLAAPVGVAGRYDWQWRVMVDGTRNVCDALTSNDGRVVVVSSIAVYGDRIQHQLCCEDDALGPWQGAYGRAKQGQERIAREIAERTGLPLTVVRPANVYGLGGASAWGDRLVSLIRETGGAVVGDGEHNNAGLVHGDNLADALVLAATRDEAVGRTYNVCDGTDVTWRQFMDDMAAVAGMPPSPGFPLEPIMAAARANEDPAACVAPRDPAIPSLEGLNLIGFDNRIAASRIRDELGWAPAISYSDAMAAMLARVA